MSHVSDYSLSDKEIITALLIYDNPMLTITAGTVDYLNPRPSAEGLNTILTVAPRPESGHSGVVDVSYDRLDIQDFVGLATSDGLEIQVDSVNMLSDIIPDVNLALGINLTEADYADVAIPAFEEDVPNDTRNIIVPMRAASLIYIGELRFLVRRSPISLTGIVSVTYLTGLSYPTAPVEG